MSPDSATRSGKAVARRVLVTGGGRGIGRGIGEALAVRGHHVAFASRTASEVLAAAEEAGNGAVGLAVDLDDLGAAAELGLRAAHALDGPIDIYVHAAGIAANGAIGRLSLDDWERSFRINVTSAFVIASELVPGMAAAGWGRIVTVCSLYSRFAVGHTAAYASSKHALLGLTRVLAAEFVTQGVTANAIVPGFVDTEMVRGELAKAAEARGLTEEEVLERFLRPQPIGRMVSVAEVGTLAAYLCSEAAAPITGQAIDIDGGWYQA